MARFSKVTVCRWYNSLIGLSIAGSDHQGLIATSGKSKIPKIVYVL